MKHHILIRTILIVICATMLLAPVAAQGSEDTVAEKVTLHLKWMHAFQFAGYYAAREQGFYEAEGLEVAIIPASTEHQAIDTVLAGQAQYGVWGSEVLNERLSGKPLVVLAVILQHSPYVVLSRMDSDIRVPSDLIGRKVMVDFGMGATQLRAMLLHEGLSPDGVEFVPHTWSMDDMIEGKVDATMEYITDEPNQMRMHGVEPFIMRPIDYGIDFYGDCLFTTESEIEEHPERVAAFRRASLKGWEYAMKHEEELIELIMGMPGVQERGLTREHLRYEAEQMHELMQPNLIQIGHINPGRWKHIADTYVSLGMLDSDDSLEGLIYEPDPPKDHRWAYALLGSLAGVLFVAGLAWVWNRQLRRAVVRQTRDLRESEERFRAITNQSLEGIAVAELDGSYTFVNPAFCQMIGYSEDELLQMTVFDVKAKSQDRSSFSKSQEDQGGPVHVLLERKDGTEFLSEIGGQTIVIDGEECVLGTVRDITESREAEAERERLMSAIEQATESVMITDPDGFLEYVNPAFLRTSGYSREEALGRNPRFLKSGAHDAAFYKAMWDTLTSGETWSGRLINKKKNGTLFTEEATISPVRDAEGRTINYVAVNRDVTQEIKLQEQFLQAQKMEAVGQLAGGVAHDFNNLLQAINGYSEMALLELDAEHSAHGHIQEVERAGARAAKLVGQLLAFSRRQVLDMKDVDLNEVIDDLSRMIGRVIGEHIALDVLVGEDLGIVRADPGQMEQVLMNLCLNARDALPEGGIIAIKTENVRLDEAFCHQHAWATPGQFVLLGVTDTGSGMDPETVANAFEPFFTTKDAGKGSGLGLSTVYGLIKQHHGLVHIDSVIGMGTTFEIYLPVVEPSAPADEEISEAPEQGGSETILLAEDDPGVLRMARDMLEHSGYTVLAAEDGEQALRVFGENAEEIDLALLDVMMPKIGGKAVYEQIRKQCPTVAVLFSSGYSMEAIHTDFVLDEGLQLLQKPYRREILLNQVREALDAGR